MYLPFRHPVVKMKSICNLQNIGDKFEWAASSFLCVSANLFFGLINLLLFALWWFPASIKKCIISIHLITLYLQTEKKWTFDTSSICLYFKSYNIYRKNYYRDCPTNGIVGFYSAILHSKDADRITNRVDTDQTAP